MIVYWSLLIWSLFIGILFSLRPRFVLVCGNVEKRARLNHVIIGFAPIIFFAGLKGKGIIDSTAYIFFFNATPDSFQNFIINFDSRGIGFDILQVIFKSFISKDYHAWFFFLALISCICIMIPLFKYSPIFGLSLFLFIASTQFTWLLNGIRQYLVVTVIFANLDLLVEKKFWKYILLIFILAPIHPTVLVMIPAYFIVQFKPWSKSVIIVIAGFCVLSLVIGKIEPIMRFLLEETGYEETFAIALTYGGTNIFRLLVAAVPVGLSFIYRKKLIKIATPINNICINMSVLNFCTYIISTQVGGNFFGRLAQYFTIYELITLPWLISKCFNKKEKQIIIFMCIVLFTIWFYYQMVITLHLPYRSDILGIYI